MQPAGGIYIRRFSVLYGRVGSNIIPTPTKCDTGFKPTFFGHANASGTRSSWLGRAVAIVLRRRAKSQILVSIVGLA